MQKFIVGINGRTGSVISALWLDATIPVLPDKISPQVSWNGGNDAADWSLPIQHTHRTELFITAPPEFKRIWCRRNYFESILSWMVAVHTDKYHLWDDNAVTEYQEKYQNTKFVIDLADFYSELKKYDNNDCIISQWQRQTRSDMIPLLYRIHAQTAQTFYNAVSLPIPEVIPGWPRPMSVNKYDLVENLSELLGVYCKFNSTVDVDKDATVARIQQYLNK